MAGSSRLDSLRTRGGTTMRTHEVAAMKTENEENAAPGISNRKRQCFIVTPAGTGGSDTGRQTLGLIATLEDILGKYSYSALADFKVINSTSITDQSITYLLNSDLVIADLSGLDSKVMYAVAVRHSTHKPMIFLAGPDTRIPFDTKGNTVITYQNDILGQRELSEELNGVIPTIINDNGRLENAIARVRRLYSPPSTNPDREDRELNKFTRIEGLQNEAAAPVAKDDHQSAPRVGDGLYAKEWVRIKVDLTKPELHNTLVNLVKVGAVKEFNIVRFANGEGELVVYGRAPCFSNMGHVFDYYHAGIKEVPYNDS